MKDGNDCRGQDFADISNQRMEALFSAEKCKREQPCQKGADSNCKYNNSIIRVIHIAEPSFVRLVFLAASIMTMEAIRAGRIKLPGPKTRSDIEPILEDNGRVRNYSIFPDDENRKFAVYYVEVEKGAYWNSEPHMKGTTEFVTVLSGQLTIRSADDEKGESIRFKADVTHSYHNSGEEAAIANMILYTV